MRSKVNFLLIAHSHKIPIVVGIFVLYLFKHVLTCLKSFKSLSSVGLYAALSEINSFISTVDELVGTRPIIYVITINFSHTQEN